MQLMICILTIDRGKVKRNKCNDVFKKFKHDLDSLVSSGPACSSAFDQRGAV